MTTESFEEYINLHTEELWIDRFCAMFAQNSIEEILEMTYLKFRTTHLDMKSQYNNALHVFKHAYIASKKLTCDSEESKQLDIFVHGVYELDALCGVYWNDPDDLEQLAKLDEDFIKFKDYYIKTKTQLSKDIFMRWFKAFAKMLFLFNGYQAPPRLDPQQAMRDAMGLTNLFEELLGSY